jgi:hypothetical protein
VLLPDGSQAIVLPLSEDADPLSGIPVDPACFPADWLVLVAFRTDRPGAFHIIARGQLDALGQQLGVPGPLPTGVSPRCVVCSPAFHWNLCLEADAAASFGVETYYITRHGISRTPARPVERRAEPGG